MKWNEICFEYIICSNHFYNNKLMIFLYTHGWNMKTLSISSHVI